MTRLAPVRDKELDMIVPLTLGDFLERAEFVYGEREAVVDEPSPPGGGLGRITYGQFAQHGAQPRRGARRSRRPRRRPRGRRLAQRDPLPREPVRRERLRPSARPRQLPAEGGRDRLHPRALGLVGPARRPRAGRAAASSETGASLRPRRGDGSSPLRPPRRSTPARGHRRERHALHQLHLGDHGPAEGRAAHPSRVLAQRRRLRLARGGERSRRLPPHPADLPLQRLGHALCPHRHGRAPGHHPQDRR